MIEQKIRNYLKAAFNLPVVHDAGQTKVEKALSVSLDVITVKTVLNVKQSFEVQATVYLRAANGYDALGYLSYGIVGNPQIDDVTAYAVSAVENVEYVEKTEILISKQVVFMIVQPYDQVREKIKIIELN